MKESQKPDWFDFTVMALSPVLIMGLVGSLALFLLDVLYGGKYVERLTWTLFFFVVGAVLVARIAIVVDPQRSKLYGFVLGGAVFLAMMKFVDHLPGSALAAFGWLINLVIIVVVLWASNRLVWNCTFLDEHDPDPGRGLLTQIASNPSRKRERREDSVAHASGSELHRGSPGLSVIYFTIAAFPLFGLGQSLIPIDDLSRRRYAFLLMTVYVSCGLGLLLTTTLLGLRRYLRQRRLAMPTQMTALWLGIGGALIAIMLIVGAFFPRPHAEYPLISFTRVGSEERDASRYGHGDASGQGEGRGGAKGEGEAQQGSGRGQEGGKSTGKSGKPEGGAGGDKGSGAKSGQKGEKGNGEQGKRGESDDQSSSSSNTAVEAIANVVKWIVLLVIGIPLLILVTIFLLRNAGFIPAWLKKWLDAIAAWWQSLIGQKSEPEAEIETAEVVRPPRPFRSFSNPFADGTAAQRTPDDLVRYSFAALDAWSAERELARNDEETPLEFVERLSIQVPDLADASRDLAKHYANLAYGRRRVPETARKQIERLWTQLGFEPAAQARD